MFRIGARHRLIDARGQIFPMLDPSQLPPSAAPTLRIAVRDANKHRLMPVLLGGILYMAAGMLIARFLPRCSASLPPGIPPPPPPTPPSLLVSITVFAVSLAVVLPLFLAFAAIGARRRGIAAVHACLEARICPSCGYLLATVPPASDGARQCPECGGAWPDHPEPRPES